MFSRLHLDLTPMRSRPFILLLLSRTITRIGSIITSTTILLHAAHLTESPFATGSVAAAQLLPVLVLGLCGLTAALLGLGALGTIYVFGPP